MNQEHYARCICQLFRVHTSSTGTIDEVALRELTNHEPPLVTVGSFSQQCLTEDGLRVVGELVAAFEEAV